MVSGSVGSDRRYLEDFAPGDRIEIPGRYEMTSERVREFATAYDPQPIHLDEPTARREMFGQIVASGWHSLAATMRLVVEARPLGETPIVGIGIENLRYIAPVRPGDLLHVTTEVLDTRASASRRQSGFMRLRVVTRNQRDEDVLSQDWTLLLPRRPQQR